MYPICCLCLVSGVLAAQAPATVTDPALGRRISDFRLADGEGRKHRLDDYSDARLVVIAFVGTECPLAKMYAPRLAELARDLKPRGVAFVAIDANRQDSAHEIAEYARRHGFPFPVLQDSGNAVADSFGALRTPEVFVLDSDRVVRYHGRIDDQYGVGYTRPEPTRRDLLEAIDELLTGRPVSTASTSAMGCLIGRVTSAAGDAPVNYSKHVAPIFHNRCVTCHRVGEIAPFSLTSYEETLGWAPTVREVVETRRMPPWLANADHGVFANESRLTDEELRTIVRWVAAGAPEGDPADLPPLPRFTDGWRIPEPDLVLEMPEPFTAPAQGTVDYQYFTVDPHFTQDTWVRAAEARPGNRSVVHHIVLVVQAPGDRPVRETGGLGSELLATFAPGMPATMLGDGLAKLVPAGSKLVFQMHYTPNGTAQTDRSKVGLVLADPRSVRRRVQGAMALNFQFVIPPGAKNHRVESQHRFGQDSLLISLFPHMHLRGKSFRFEAEYPDGQRETLLDVPRWDFNWQNQYVLAKPKTMPEGTVLHCTAHFDNSADNLANPNPNELVAFGEQTWQEMMVGFLDATPLHQDLTLGGPQAREVEGGGFEVVFRYTPNEPAEAVYLAGSFNEWQTTAHRMDGPDADGGFRTRVTLPAGDHEYKFILDGTKWRPDPRNYRQTGFFNNSLLVLAGSAPARVANCTPLDLQAKANHELVQDFSDPTPGNNLAELPTGEQVLLGIPFRIGPGLIGLGSRIKTEQPARVEGIRVGTKFVKLHILHATEFGESAAGTDRHVSDGTQIGQYTVHYADDTEETVPIIYGEDVRDWWFSDRSKGTTRGQVAWKGSNAFSRRYGAKIRLYLTTWRNPKPAVLVTHIDFSSSHTAAAPWCAAMSAQSE